MDGFVTTVVLPAEVKLDKIQAGQSAITDKIAKITTVLEKSRLEINGLENKLQNFPPLLDNPQSVSTESHQDIVKTCVAKVVFDIKRRDSNVIVVGLPERQGASDEAAFSSFCEGNLSVKPSIVWCRRLGRNNFQSSDQKPRRLLVRLRAAEVATDLCRA